MPATIAMTRRLPCKPASCKGAGLHSRARTNMKRIGHDALILGGWLATCVASGSAVTFVALTLA